ncbi:CBS domain-containing protein [Almyronema epifaneia]|uniref:CBS domain-containing protein n=1 Tax=Almyronema epifaneia S1 TaxID=2991925 RepID=A0ABW6IJF8_9CYAN
MDLVLCHTTADFDALGAAVGVSRLQAGTRIVLAGGCHPTVQNFLALHRDEYPLLERRAVDPEKIRSLVFVDAQQRQRFLPVLDWIELAERQHLDITIYDHHLTAAADIAAQTLVIEPVGATTTLIAEVLQQRGIQLSLAEATVMALGIHVDTGSLTYEQSTARDAKALAWLMEQGASLSAIAEFVEPGLSPRLQDLLPQALKQLQSQSLQGYQLAWVLLPLDGYLPGLSSLASRLISVTHSDVLLLGAHYGLKESKTEKLIVIGRSRDRHQFDDGVNLAQLLEPIGGGGHAAAAAAIVRSQNPQQTFAQLVEQLQQQLPHPPTARELMSSPVRTIRPQTSIAEAQRILLRYGHSGLSVVNSAGDLVGIISRRDIDLALHHGFSHAPVKGYMSTRLKTITPDTLLPEIETLMVTYDIGRLPVLSQNQLVGIVTRTDVLRQRQQGRLGKQLAPDSTASVAPTAKTVQQRLTQRLPLHLQDILQIMANAATKRGWHLYLVGGAVRDFFLTEAKTLALQDVDLVVDGFYQNAQAGAGVELAQLVQQQYPAVELQVYGRFQTAALIWHSQEDQQPLMIDIATARTEFYPYPAANPEVEASSIRQDLYRRDFTINAMAVCLTPPQPGVLLDYFGGLIDLQERQVRVLHANSFIEDPTRIYRAVRFAVRLEFRIESQTESYIRYALSSGIYSKMQEQVAKVPALQTRLKRELQYILEAPYWQSALGLLDKLGALKCLHSSLEMSDRLWHQLRRVSRWLERFQFHSAIAPWQLRLEVLIAQLQPRFRHTVATNLQLPSETIYRLKQLEAVEAELAQNLPTAQQPSQIVRQLRRYDLPLLLLISARQPRPTGQKIWQYLTQWSQVKAPLDGNDLKALGYQPGPQFKAILDDVLAATLDQQLQTRQEAIAFVTEHYAITGASRQRS